MSGKYGDLIKEARKQENQKDSLPVNQQDNKTESQITSRESDSLREIKQVNLSIKVPESLRRHWVSEAKRQGTSLTAEIMEAMKNRFGLPKE